MAGGKMDYKPYREFRSEYPPEYKMSEEEFKETFDRHYKRWTKEEEKQVLEELRSLDGEGCSLYQIVIMLSREVGRTWKSLRSRFSMPRLEMEYLFSLIDRKKYVELMRRIVPSRDYRRSTELKRLLIKRDELFGESIKEKKVEEELQGKEDNWSLRYDPSNLLIDEEKDH